MSRKKDLVAAVLAVLLLLLGASLAVRLLATAVILAPLGLLLGMPFPLGLARLERSPDLIPWAWAMNGSASAVASVAVALLALSAGFTAVLAAAVVAYGLVAVVGWGWVSSVPPSAAQS
jgi:hypothetical protein